MRILPFVVGLALVASAAGCVDQPAASDVGAASTEGASLDPAVIVDPTSLLEEGAAGGVGASAPVWAVGDAWAIRSSDGQTEEAAFLVVTDASADSYTLSTTSETLAGYDAMFDISYLGKIRARDLAGHQQDSPIQYFAFPLADGKTWTTQWDGAEIALAAKKSPRGFDITGTREGEPYVTYDFIPELKWWSHLDFAEGYGVKIDRIVPAWTGELAIATAALVFESIPAAPVVSQGSGAFTVSEGQTMAMLTLQGGGAMWARTLRLVDPSGMPHSTETPDFATSDSPAGPSSYFHQEPLPPTPGEWHVLAPTLHDTSGGGVVTVHEVAVVKKLFP